MARAGPGQLRQGACCIEDQLVEGCYPWWWQARETSVLLGRVGSQRSVLSWGHCDRRWGRGETARPGVVTVWSRLELVRLARHGQEAEERARSGCASFSPRTSVFSSARWGDGTQRVILVSAPAS